MMHYLVFYVALIISFWVDMYILYFKLLLRTLLFIKRKCTSITYLLLFYLLFDMNMSWVSSLLASMHFEQWGNGSNYSLKYALLELAVCCEHELSTFSSCIYAFWATRYGSNLKYALLELAQVDVIWVEVLGSTIEVMVTTPWYTKFYVF